jgi:P-type Cu2+ transporter
LVSTAGTFDPTGMWGREVYFDSFTMFVFFLLTGRWLQERLQDRTAGALESLMNRLPDRVLRRNAQHQFVPTAVRRVMVGDILRVMPGEAFAVDGLITQGDTQVDEALLTGESTPQRRSVGAAVVTGSYNLQACVEVQVTRVGQHTRFAHIVALMESAVLQKPRLAQLADRVARPFLVLVLVAALAAGWWWWESSPAHAVMVAVAVLIVTCPCALSLATPVAMLTAAGTLAKQGVMVRRMQALETLAQIDTIIFDKTGTLTRDGMGVAGVHVAASAGLFDDDLQNQQQNDVQIDQKNRVLSLAAAIAAHSMHPASRALVAAAHHTDAATAPWHIADCQEIPGAGLLATVTFVDVDAPAQEKNTQDVVQPRRFRLGSALYALAGAADVDALLSGATAEATMGTGGVVLSAETEAGGWAECARFDLTETVRPEAPAVVQALQKMGIQVQLLSGDIPVSVARVAAQVGMAADAWAASCTPEDKLQRMQHLQLQGRCVAMVGDGLNDGPVLAGAHVSFAFGRAVPLAQAQSDVVVLGDTLSHVVQTLSLARRTMRIIGQNLAWALAYNVLCIPLAVVGWMPAWLAGLGMAASSLLVVLNAARLTKALAPDALAGLGHAQMLAPPKSTPLAAMPTGAMPYAMSMPTEPKGT